MEEAAAFRLERAVTEWRARVAASPGVRAEDVAELESHLRDTVAALVRSGASEQLAFDRATERLGTPAVIGREFAKINAADAWIERTMWCALGILVSTVLWGGTGMLASWLVAILLPMLGHPLVRAGDALVGPGGSLSLGAGPAREYLNTILLPAGLRILIQGSMVSAGLARLSHLLQGPRRLQASRSRLVRFVVGMTLAIYALQIAPYLLLPLLRTAGLPQYFGEGYGFARFATNVPATLLQAAVTAFLVAWAARRFTRSSGDGDAGVWMVFGAVGVRLLANFTLFIGRVVALGGLRSFDYPFSENNSWYAAGTVILVIQCGLVAWLGIAAWRFAHRRDAQLATIGASWFRKPVAFGLVAAGVQTVLGTVAAVFDISWNVVMGRRADGVIGGMIVSGNFASFWWTMLTPLALGALVLWLGRSPSRSGRESPTPV